MVLTRADARAAFNFVMDNVLRRDNNSPLRRSLVANQLDDILELLSLAMRPDDIDTFTYDVSETERNVRLPLGDRNLLRIFIKYVLVRNAGPDPIGEAWLSLTPQAFDDFRVSPEAYTTSDGSRPVPLAPNPVVRPEAATQR